MRPTVSVIIPNYNYARFVGAAVDSVLSQTYACKEIIVIDDGSTDDSLEILAAYAGKGVQVLRQQNRGVGAARNAGIKHSTGDLVAFLDADDLWLPEKIEKQVARLVNDEEFGFVSCYMREFGPSGETIRVYNDGKEGWRANDLLLIEAVVIGPGSCGILWRRIFDRVGGFDETKEMHPSEDWEFCYRVARECKIAFVPEVLVDYRNHGGNSHLQIPRVERAVTLAMKKIFDNPSPEAVKLRNKSYANMHLMLSGSFFQAGEIGKSVGHAIKSIYYNPGNFTRIIKRVL